MIWMSLWGIRESLPSHGCEGVGHGGRGGCWSRPALQLAHQAGARWRGMPCASSSQSFTAVQYQGDVKNSRAGPEQLTAGMWNVEHTSASPTSQRGSLRTVTSADETDFRWSFGLRTPCRSSSGFPPLNSSNSHINCLLRRRCLHSHTSGSPTVSCLQSRKRNLCRDTWRIIPAGDLFGGRELQRREKESV